MKRKQRKTRKGKQKVGGVARLAEWSLPTPEIRSSDPAIGIYIDHCLLLTIDKTTMKKKSPIFKNRKTCKQELSIRSWVCLISKMVTSH